MILCHCEQLPTGDSPTSWWKTITSIRSSYSSYDSWDFSITVEQSSQLRMSRLIKPNGHSPYHPYYPTSYPDRANNFRFSAKNNLQPLLGKGKTLPSFTEGLKDPALFDGIARQASYPHSHSEACRCCPMFIRMLRQISTSATNPGSFITWHDMLTSPLTRHASKALNSIRR